MLPRVLLAVLLLCACKERHAAHEEPAPPSVLTETAAPHAVALTFTYPGRVVASAEVEIRARVAGVLQRRLFAEGARVRAGDVLYRIDPAPYRAALDHAAAMLQQARATEDKAERDLRRATALAQTLAGTAQARDDAVSTLAMAQAGVALADADQRAAALNLSYTQVVSPIEGVTSLSVMSEGALVGTTADNTLLTRVTTTDPVYVSFAFDARDFEEIGRLSAGVPLTAHVAAGGVDHAGKIDFVDAVVDQATGTVRARATLANADLSLRPGAFVSVGVSGAALPDAVTVPQAAVQQDAAGAFVFTVRDAHAVRAPVTLGRRDGDAQIVDGLPSGSAVITEGAVRVHAGDAVRVDTRAAAR